MNSIYSSLGSACLLTALGLWSPPSMATETQPAFEWNPIDPIRLSDIRGGMMLPGGMLVSFGIERLVYINGELAAGAKLQIDNIANVTPEQALQLAKINEGLLVSVGQGGVLDSVSMPNTLVIQNSLDGQDIRAATTLNLGVDTLGDLMRLNAADALQQALINSVGSP